MRHCQAIITKQKKYSVTLASIILRLKSVPQIVCCIQKSMQMRMRVLCVVSLDGNQVIFILQMSSISHQRKKKISAKVLR